jgi:hypothetical protein
MTCQNSQPTSKYFKGRCCYEEVLVDDNTKAVLCWKCTAMMAPPPEEKKPSGYPRGWKFMVEFVDKEGNVYHKGELQEKLFGTLPPTEIKEKEKKTRTKKKKDSLDDKIISELKKRELKKKVTKKTVKKTTKK